MNFMRIHPHVGIFMMKHQNTPFVYTLSLHFGTDWSHFSSPLKSSFILVTLFKQLIPMWSNSKQRTSGSIVYKSPDVYCAMCFGRRCMRWKRSSCAVDHWETDANQLFLSSVLLIFVWHFVYNVLQHITP